MEETNYSAAHSGVHVAPLNIDKRIRRNTSGASRKSRASHARDQSRSSSNQYTPPPTPKTSRESLQQASHEDDSAAVAQPYLRAFFPFHPTFSPDSSTVTLPLNAGDVILVHSIHTNGWADGTMLSSGARGWLPTNYCESYEANQITPLLRSGTSLFDQFRGGSTAGTRQSQLAITAVVAGVKYLLESTDCLTRTSDNVKASDRVSKSRKLLLTELSGLVKSAKQLPGHSEGAANLNPAEIEEITDEMILRTFKIVLRGVRFLDIWYDQYAKKLEAQDHAEAVAEAAQLQLAEAQAEANEAIPPTPPADSFMHSLSSSVSSMPSTPHGDGSFADSYFSPRSSSRNQNQFAPSCGGVGSGTRKPESYPLPSTPHAQTPRGGPSPDIPRYYSQEEIVESPVAVQSLVITHALGRLNSCHDLLLTFLGSYIGRIQYQQARFTPQLQLSQQQSVTAARELLTVVEAVYARDPRAHALGHAKDAMYNHIACLIAAGEQVVSNRIEEMDDDEEEGIMIPDGGRGLVDAATGCVRGAGECVAKSKFVIERIGDFELNLACVGTVGIGLGISTDSQEPVVIEQTVEIQLPPQEDLDRDLMPPPPTPEKALPSPTLQDELCVQKRRQSSAAGIASLKIDTNLSSKPVSGPPERAESRTPTEASARPMSAKSLLPPVPTVSGLLDHGPYAASPLQHTEPAKTMSDVTNRVWTDSIGAESATATDSTGGNSFRGSEDSMLSRTSTRATTPEPISSTSIGTPLLGTDLTMGNNSSHVSLLSTYTSNRSYADDLAFNKDGQIIGGTLPALVERLTINDSTPDAVFVATFYLTFRLFTTPREFAQALVDRFDEVATGSPGCMPVRLRVYNVFKGWLESHWRNVSDNEALDVIVSFADTRLQENLPQAAIRLRCLADKVTVNDGPLVPRLVSGMGKTTTATTTYSVVETPIPAPVISRGQLGLLKAALVPGGNTPNFLDFDPLELARQFTLKESRMFCSICPEELIAQEWTKKRGSLSQNVLAMSALSTDLAHLVAESILDIQDVKARARVIKHWIKVADRCLELNNYDSLMAIMCTMNTSTIVRLKKTWELVPQKSKTTLEHLRSVIDVSKNQAILRARLKNHVPPCLPFLGTYLTDLTFIDVGNPSKRPVSIDGSTKHLINFDKHVKTAKIISELQRFQIPYRIQEVPEMQRWIDGQLERIHNSKAADVQHLYRRSLLLEPRENQQLKLTTSVPQATTPQPTPTVPAKETSTKESLFTWTHMFKTPTNNQ